MERKKSICQRIEEIICEKGELPEYFEPEEREYEENELRFAPGAMEGILGHHASGKGETNDFLDTLKDYLQLSEVDAMTQFEERLTKDFHVATMRNDLLEKIIEHKEDYNAAKLANLGYHFAKNGTKNETVKLGLSLLALFNFSENEKVCHVLKTLGYCEEFTDYVLMNTYDWEEKKRQDFYFELAKELKGWGKINVVEMLEADSEEKKEWLLCYGCRNSVLYSYLGLVCAEKCDLYARLEQGNLTDEELRGAGDIMEGLTDEGPCAGMSALEKPVELTLLYLEELEKHMQAGACEGCLQDIVVDIKSVLLLCWIDDYFADSEIENAQAVCVRIQKLLDGMDKHQLIVDNLTENTHACLQLARKYDIDLSQQILELIRMDFGKYYTYSYYLLNKNKCVDEFLEICDREIDAERYPQKMADSLGLGNLGEGVLAMDMIVQYLDRYPLKGQKLIVISIQSPFTRWRNMAAKALLGWTEALNKPLSEIDKDLYGMVQAVAAIECNDKTKEQWNQLL